MVRSLLRGLRASQNALEGYLFDLLLHY